MTNNNQNQQGGQKSDRNQQGGQRDDRSRPQHQQDGGMREKEERKAGQPMPNQPNREANRKMDDDNASDRRSGR